MRLRVEYFDAYHVFLNARAIVSQAGEALDIFRPIGISLLYTPLFALENTRLSFLVPFPACHLFAVILFAFLLLALYRLLRLHFPALPALLGVTVFAFNPLVIHLAPFSKEDMPATLFTTAALLFFLRWKQSRCERHFLAVLAFSTAAIATRYNLLPVLPPFLALFAISDSKTRLWKARLSRAILFSTVPLGAFFLLSSALYVALGKTPLAAAPRQVFSDLVEQYRFNHSIGYKPPMVAFVFLIRLVPPALRLATVLGLVGSLFKPKRLDPFWAIWFFGFFLFHAYIVPGKEARYLLPVLPAVAYFSVRGLMIFHEWMMSTLTSRPGRAWYATVIFLLFGLWPARIPFASA